MADNVAITAGSGTTVATDDVGGVHYQIVKIAHGAADSATQTSSAAPLPSTLTNLEKAEDAAHTTGDKGVMLLAVRKDTATALAGADGDYIPIITDSAGRVHVRTGAEYAEDGTHTDADRGLFILAVRNDTGAALAGADGDYIALTTDSTGKLWVSSNTEYAEDTAHTSGELGQFILGVRNDSGASFSGTHGDYTPIAVDNAGGLRLAVEIKDDDAFTPGTDFVTPSGGVYQSTVDEVDAGDAGALRMSARRGLISAPDSRVVTIYYGSVALPGDLEISTTGAATGYGAPTTAQLSFATFSDPTYIRIPMSSWSNISIQIFQNSGAAATVSLIPWITGGSLITLDNAALYAVYSASVANGANYTFMSDAGGTGVGTSMINVPALRIPMSYLVVKISGTPVSNGYGVIVHRRA